MAPPKPTSSVTNPLAADLECGGHNVANARQVSAEVVYATGNIVTDSTGPKDPSVEGEYAGVGSLYIRTGPPELWQKTGDTDTGWTKR